MLRKLNHIITKFQNDLVNDDEDEDDDDEDIIFTQVER